MYTLSMLLLRPSFLLCLAAAGVLGRVHLPPRGDVTAQRGNEMWRRQTTSTYDFWWPFPAATTPAEGTTTTSTTSAPATVIPILIPTISSPTPSSAPSSSNALPLSTTTAQVSPSSTSTSASATSSLAPTQAPTPSQNSDATAKFDARTIAPAVAGGVGLLLLVLAVWILWGVCTRRPRVARKDGGGLVAGPAYSAIGRGGMGDVEHASIHRGDGHAGARWGAKHEEEEEGMLDVPKDGGTDASGGYRWPSYGFPPEFNDDDESKHRAPSLNNHKYDEDELQTLLLVAPGHERRLSLSNSVGGGSEYTTLARMRSDATSAALHALSAAPNEYGDENESSQVGAGVARPGSFRRVLAARVEAERVWTESVRVARARGAEAGAGVRGVFDISGDELGGGGGKESEEKNEGGRRRRGHVRADSDVRVGEPAPTALRSPPPHQYPLSPPPPTPMHTRSPPARPPMSPPPLKRPPPARGRRSTARLKDSEEEGEDRYTRRPTRRSASRGGNSSAGGSRSASRGGDRSGGGSASRSPVARRARPRSRAGEQGRGAKGREGVGGGAFLPQSPAQLMSPALARQMCFTPIPSPDPSSSVANPMSPRSPRASARASKRDGKRSERRSDSDKEKDKDMPPLPLPDALRGRLRKKRSASAARGSTAADGGMGTPPHGGEQGQEDAAGAAQRVDDIMAAGWGARGLGQAGMRSLSPTGFGRG